MLNLEQFRLLQPYNFADFQQQRIDIGRAYDGIASIMDSSARMVESAAQISQKQLAQNQSSPDYGDFFSRIGSLFSNHSSGWGAPSNEILNVNEALQSWIP